MVKSKVEAVIQGNKVTYKKYVNAPIDLVFEAWTAHEHLSQWWGPDGFTITTKTMNFTNGGFWEFIMHGPDGHDYKNKIQIVDIKKPHHIFYKHLGDGEGETDVHFEARILFEEKGEGTYLVMEQIFPSKEELERINTKYGAVEGGKQHIENLEKYIESLSD